MIGDDDDGHDGGGTVDHIGGGNAGVADLR